MGMCMRFSVHWAKALVCTCLMTIQMEGGGGGGGGGEGSLLTKFALVTYGRILYWTHPW